MEPLPNPPLRKPGRRAFLWSLASRRSRLPTHSQPLAAKSDKDAETVFRIRTPECEVRMSVEYFSNSEIGSFRFRDSLAERAFCLSSNGEEARANGDNTKEDNTNAVISPPRPLTPDEIEALLAADVPGRLATLDRHGFPHVTPLWFIWADGAFHLTSLPDRAHVRRLERDPRAGICIDLEEPERARR